MDHIYYTHKNIKLLNRKTLNYSDTIVDLAVRYQIGMDVKINLKKAIRLYQKAVELNNTRAMFNLGYTMFKLANNIKIKIDKIRNDEEYKEGKIGSLFFKYSNYAQKAFKLYQKAAKLDNVNAMINLAICYMESFGTKQDFEEAFKWYKKAAELDNVNAMNNLAFCYAKGIGTKQDFEEAFKWYKKAAELGDVKATNNTAICYAKGIGTKQDFEEAFKWYKKAAELDNVNAMNNLAFCYTKGIGTKQDFEEAFKWYKKAAELDNVNAMNNLAFCYAKGIGTKQDFEEAFKWYKKAADKNHKQAGYKCITYCAKGIYDDDKKKYCFEPNLVEAFKYLQKYFNIKDEKNFYDQNSEGIKYILTNTIQLCLCGSDYHFNIKNLEQLNSYTKNIEKFLQKNFGDFYENYNENNKQISEEDKKKYILDLKYRGSDLGLIIIKNNKEYFLKLYPYNKEKYKEKLMELEYFKLLGKENSMKIFDLYANKDKKDGCIIFCSEQALTEDYELFPDFDFKQFEGLKGENLKINQQFKNLNQFFKIIIYSMMLNLGDVRDTNVLMALEEQDKNKDIRIKLIDFWLARHGNIEELPNEIKLIDSYNEKEIQTIMKNPFLLKNIANNSPSQIFLKKCIYLFLLAQSRNIVGTITNKGSQGICNVITDILKFIQKNPKIAKTLEENVFNYIEEVFDKVKGLNDEVEKLIDKLEKQLEYKKTEDNKKLLELLTVKTDILEKLSIRYEYLEKKLQLILEQKETIQKKEKTIEILKTEESAKENFEEPNCIYTKSTNATEGAKMREANIKLLDKTKEFEQFAETVKKSKNIIDKTINNTKNDSLILRN